MKKTKLLSLVTILCFLCCYLLSSAAAGDMLSLFMMIQLRGKAASPKISLNADPATIMLGNTATLSWTSKKADTVSIDNGIGAVALSGSMSVQPTATTTYAN